MTEQTYTGKLALITGGSSGIGLAIASQLAAQGARVWILARGADKLAAAVSQINASAPAQPIRSLQADVSDFAALAGAVKQMEAEAGIPDFLFNCAGVAEVGRFFDLDMAVFRSMMEINYFGTVNMIHAAGHGMAARGSGHIVNFSSVAGFLGVYGYSAYGPSKFAVRGLSDTLRYEFSEHGIRISIVFPPDTQTPQLDYENQHKPPILRELDKANKVLQPEAVAETVLKGVAKGRYVITPGFDSTLYFQLSNFFGLVYPVMDGMVAAARRAVSRDRSGSKHNR